MSSDPRDQPFLHDLVTTLRAPMVALAGADGQVREVGVQGVYAYDRRVLSGFVVSVDGHEPPCVATELVGASGTVSTYAPRGVGDLIADPTVLLRRTRVVRSDRVTETLRISSRARVAVALSLGVHLASDLAELEVVKQGARARPLAPVADADGIHWAAEHLRADVAASPAPTSVSTDASGADLRWQLELDPGADVEVVLTARVQDDGTPLPFTAQHGSPWATVRVRADDSRVGPLVARGLDDLGALLLADDHDVFAAAGSPWFFTLFGRDSIWTARLLLPLGTDLAMGTLRALARRQGRADVAATEEQPGKILHEVRRDGLDVGDLSLPPVYYGTVDATPLWVTLLVEAWRWGADPAAVAPLLPAAEAALGWLREQVAADPTGFVRYVDRSGSGLQNQGWKDSGDSVQWADGHLADAPIALCEVQAYAYEAAVGGADLLAAFGRPGAESLRQWAAELRQRFRRQFWVEDDQGRYPAIALDRDGRAVDGIASNMGHLLGTGLLDADEAATVAARLAGPDLDSGYGLRTLSSRSPRFSPMSYHGGAVWPHDTAITARGLLLEGHDDVAASLLTGLLAGAGAFADRLPELYAGVQADASGPLPYPASCRPQAWSAAAGTCVATLALGLRPDVPGGTLTLGPPSVQPWGELSVDGLRLGDHPLSVTVHRDGSATATSSHPDVLVRTGPAQVGVS
ncbi:MAG: glycogen debranching N-terminal domain-containing protein [Actinomycetota bacterium]